MLRRILGHRLLHNTPPCRRRPHWWWVWYKYYWRNHQHYNYHVILHYQQPKRRWNLFHPFPVKVHTYYMAIHIMEPFDINVIIWFFFFWSGKIKPFLIWTLKQNHLSIPQLNHLFILPKKKPYNNSNFWNKMRQYDSIFCMFSVFIQNCLFIFNIE